VHKFAFQRKVLAALVALTPFAFAQNTGVAVLTGSGNVFLNGAQLSNSNAVVSGDVIQTKENGTAAINGPGGSIAIEPNSIVRFQGQSVALDRGQISVATGQSLSVNARDFRIVPVSNDWTQFYVTRTSGYINVIARKNDVTINCGTNGSERVREGHQVSRLDADNCGLATIKGRGAPAAAHGPILTSAAAKWTALGVGGGLTIWSLSHGDNPVSPEGP
jgi:hypothetical protein